MFRCFFLIIILCFSSSSVMCEIDLRTLKLMAEGLDISGLKVKKKAEPRRETKGDLGFLKARNRREYKEYESSIEAGNAKEKEAQKEKAHNLKSIDSLKIVSKLYKDAAQHFQKALAYEHIFLKDYEYFLQEKVNLSLANRYEALAEINEIKIKGKNNREKSILLKDAANYRQKAAEHFKGEKSLYNLQRFEEDLGLALKFAKKDDDAKLCSFHTTQKERKLNKNAKSKRFKRSFGKSKFSSFVIPISGQKGVPLNLLGDNSGKFSEKPWFSKIKRLKRSQITDLKGGDWEITKEYKMAFENPVVAFGDSVGGSPLYVDKSYSFGVYAGDLFWFTSSRKFEPGDYHQDVCLKIKVYDKGAFAQDSANIEPIHEELIAIPIKRHTNKWTELDNPHLDTLWENSYVLDSGCSFTPETTLEEEYGLKTTISHTGEKNTWGTGLYDSSLIINHKSSSSDYYFLVELKGRLYAKTLLKDVIVDFISSDDKFSSMYALDFSESVPKVADYIVKTNFNKDPKPAHYVEDELMLAEMDISIDDLEIDIDNVQDCKDLSTSYSILDKFVEQMGKDPISLASYVQNEIELIDGIEWPGGDKDCSRKIMPGKVHRNPLITFLEGQGSPWEQCDLLVYLLRKAGFAAAYAEGDGCLAMPTDFLSQMFRMQLKDVVNHFGRKLLEDLGGILPETVFLNYPWVVFYDEESKSFKNIFPWIKNTKIEEGEELYDFLPEGYKTATEWIRKYLENDPAIMKYVDPKENNDTAAVLFKRFLEGELKKHGMTIEDVGVSYTNQKRHFSSWDSFPKPVTRNKPIKVIKNLDEKPELFATIKLSVSSKENPSKKIEAEEMRVYDIYNRKLYMYFKPISGNARETKHRMYLKLDPYDGNSTDDLMDILFDSSDKKIKVKILYDKHIEDSEKTFHWKNFPGIYSNTSKEVTMTINKGVTAAVCINFGRVTKEILEFHANKFNSQKENHNLYEKHGAITFLAGLSYFEKISKGQDFFRELYKVNNATFFTVGLSKLSPNYTENSSNMSLRGNFIGEPVLVFPQVDMYISANKRIGNDSIRPDLGNESFVTQLDFNQMIITDGSSNEHQVLNDFYNDRHAISTVKLLQLAHKRRMEFGKSGSGFLKFTRRVFKEAAKYPDIAKRSYFNYFGEYFKLADVIKDAGWQWRSLAETFGFDLKSRKFDGSKPESAYVIAYMTPGIVYSDDGDIYDPDNLPSYGGMGTLVFARDHMIAMISGNDTFMNGGYGSRLKEDTFKKGNVDNIDFFQGDNGQISLDGGNFDKPSQTSSEPNLKDVLDDSSFDLKARQQPYENFKKRFDALNNIRWDHMPEDFQSMRDSGFRADIERNIFDKSALYNDISLERKSAFQKVADPVDVVSGAFYINSVDISLGGPFDLEIKRNYNSNNPIKGAFSYGWKRSIVSFLVEGEDGTISAAEMDGSVILYSPKGDIWVVDSQKNPELTNSGVGNFHSWIERAENGYVLHGADGSTRTYEVMSFPIGEIERERPYLVKWVNKRGNEIGFEYGQNGLEDYGNIVRIVSNNGSFIGFKHNEYGLVKEAYSDDGRRICYEYDNFCDLVKVILPDGSEINYEYEHKLEKKVYYSTHRIVREVKPSGRVLENIYDKKGRVIEQKIAIEDPFKLVPNVFFSYVKDADDEDPISIREVRDALGNVTRYKIYDGMIFYISDPLGNVTRQSWFLQENNYFDAFDEKVKPAAEGFYPKSLQQMVDKRGLTTNYLYDDSGNVIEKSYTGDDLLGDGAKKTIKTKYLYNDDNLVTKASYVNGRDVNFSYDGYLLTRVEDRINGDLVSISIMEYESANGLHGLLVLKTLFDKDDNLQKWIEFENDSRGFPKKRIDHAIESSNNRVVDLFYNRHGKLSREVNEIGFSTCYEYDIMGRLIATKHLTPSGEVLSSVFNYYNANGDLEWTHGPQQNPANYVLNKYDKAGNLIFNAKWRSAASGTGTSVASVPGSDTFLQQAITLLEYNERGDLVRSFDPEGNVAEMEYNSIAQAKRKVIRPGCGEKPLLDEQYEYEEGGLLSKVTYMDGSLVSYEYTTLGLLKRQVNADGTELEFVYDFSGRVVRKKEPYSGFWSISYDDFENSITTTHEQTGIEEKRYYDIKGNVVKLVDGEGYTFLMVYDGLNRLVSKTDLETGFETTYGRLINKDIYDHDSTSECAFELDPSGNEKTKCYDYLNRLTLEQFTDRGSEELISFLKNYNYCSDHHCTLWSCGLEQSLKGQSFFDNSGNKVIDWSYLKDAYAGYPTVYRYNRSGNLVSQVNLGWKHQLIHRGMDVVFGGVENDELPRISYTYDGLGRVSSKSLSGGALTNYVYDTQGRLTSMAMPGGVVSSSHYNSSGKTFEEVSSGDSSTREFGYEYYQDGPSKGLLKSISKPNGIKHHYKYDSLGRLIEQQTTNASVKYTYDRRSLVISIEKFSGGHTTKVNKLYDHKGRINSETVFLDGQKISSYIQDWGADGFRSQIFSDGVARGFSYNAVGKMVFSSIATEGNDCFSTYEYFLDGFMSKRRSPCAETIYEYDYRGLTTKIASDNFEQAMTWDQNDRLSEYKANSQSAAYTYSERGLLLKESVPTDEVSYSFDFGREDGIGMLTDVQLSNQESCFLEKDWSFPQECLGAGIYLKCDSNDYIYDYDSCGNLILIEDGIGGDSKELFWDDFGKLQKARTSTYTWEAIYDGLGRRIRTIYTPIESGQEVLDRQIIMTFSFDPEVEFLDLDITIEKSSGKELFHKTYGPDTAGSYGGMQGTGALEAIISSSGNIYGLINDYFGNVVSIFAHEGEDWQHVEDLQTSTYGQPFGVVATDSLSFLRSMRWRGRLQDPTGFINLGARYYAPALRRFISADPLGHASTADLYTFASGDPINYFDPDGRFASKAYEVVKPAALEFAKGFEEVYIGFKFGAPETLTQYYARRFGHQVGLALGLVEMVYGSLWIAGGLATSGLVSGFSGGAGLVLVPAIEVVTVGVGVSAIGYGTFALKNYKNLDYEKPKRHRPKTTGANKKDAKQIDDVARKYGIDRHDFSDYLHEVKDGLNRGSSKNFSWKELEYWAENFQLERGL